MTTPAYNNRLVLPDPPSKNEQALLLWANNHVVNGLLPGENVTLSAVEQTLTPYNPIDVPDTGIVTINATGGGGGGDYASLTGPGKTDTPGDLVQAGGFNVDDSEGSDILLKTVGGIIELEASNGASLVLDDSTGDISLNAPQIGTTVAVGAVNGTLDLYGSPLMVQTNATFLLGFFGGGPDVQQTVTGSRGGNAALASLLTALASYGLIIDSSTP
jgi:hypothetical protein